MNRDERQQVVQALRAAARTLQASSVQAPPAMQKDILEWVLAVVAANTIATLEQGHKGKNATKSSDDAALEARYAPLRAAIAGLLKEPTSWKAYKDFMEKMWIFGAMSKPSIKQFQKLTPEGKKELATRMTAQAHDAEKRIADDIAWHQRDRESKMDDESAEMADLRPFVRPGVEAMTSPEIKRDFPIDTTGWRYGTDALLAKLRKTLEKEYGDKIDTLTFLLSKVQSRPRDTEAEPDDPFLPENLIKSIEEAKEAVRTGQFPDWNKIRVVLGTKPVQNEAAYWQGATKTLRIVVPERARPMELDGLGDSLEHELQHFAQTWLSAVAGNVNFAIAGFPAKKFRTPAFKQHQGVGMPGADNPEAKALRQSLVKEGLNPKFINWHDLDDIEFYTELLAAIKDFRKGIKDHSPASEALRQSELRLAVKVFTLTATRSEFDQFRTVGYGSKLRIAPDDFFAALSRSKQSAAKKQKALSEFVKAVL